MESLGTTEISWPSRKPRKERCGIHKRYVSLSDRIEELQSRSCLKNPVEQGTDHGGRDHTAKAVAWAVFQRHREGGVGAHGLPHHGSMSTVRRPTRFKIEAEMKQEVAYWSVCEAAAEGGGAGSTLYDSFELNSLLRTLHEAAHLPPAGIMAQQQKQAGDSDDEEEADHAVLVCSPTHWTSPYPEPHDPSEHHGHWSLGEAEARRLDTTFDERSPSEAHGQPAGYVKHGHDDANDDSSSVFGHWYTPKSIGRRPFNILNEGTPAMARASHQHQHQRHNRWRSLLHTLHLDGANGLFHGLYKFHTQVAPHDLEKTQEHKLGRRLRHKFNHRGHGSHGDAHLDRELDYNGHFEPNDLHDSKDVNHPSEEGDGHHHHPHVWKFGFKTALKLPFCRPGHLLSDDEGSDWEGSHKSHKKHHGHRHADLRAAWSSLTANLLHHHDHKRKLEGLRDGLQGDDQQPVIEHHHHHHVQPEGEDNELTAQAISMLVIAGTSVDEKRTTD